MAGPYTGAWRQSVVEQTSYSGALKQGTGFNPVHRIAGMGPYLGGPAKQVIDPITTGGGIDATDFIAEDNAWSNGVDNPDPNLPQYDITEPSIYGYNSDTGVADRDRWDVTQTDRNSNEQGWGLPNPDDVPEMVPTDSRSKTQNDTTNNWPSWGGHSQGPGNPKTHPSGMAIRAIRRGAKLITSARVLPNEDVAQGWENKSKGIAADSRPADDTQVFMQTSQTQRYKTRSGSQRSGSQSTFEAPIDSRVVGQKLKVYAGSDSARHWDMLPYEQEDFPRPFLSRQAGTGYPQWQLVNEMYVSPAIQREPAADPSLGPVAGTVFSDPSQYGYTTEDVYY